MSTTGLEVRRTEPRRATVHFASDVVEERGRAVAGPPRGEGGVGQGGCRAESAVSKDGSRGAASGGQGLYSSANGQSSRKRQGAPGSDVARGRTSSYSAPRRPRQEEARRDWRAFTSAGNVPLVKSKQGKGARKGRTHGSEDWDKRRHAGIAEVPSWRRRSAGHVVEGVPGWRRFSGLGSQNSGMIDPVGAMALQGVGGLAVRSPAPGGTAGGG